MNEVIEQVLFEGTNQEKIELFSFTDEDDINIIYKKFLLFSKFNYTRYFTNKQSDKHKELTLHYLSVYLGEKNFIIKGFRGCAKTSIMKLVMAYVLANDRRTNQRRYMKILCRDLANAKQITTDVYNMLLEIIPIYGDLFEKEGDKKREETMGGFTMKGDRKFTAGSVGQDQRGKIQDAYRPDFLWFDDIEDRTSISSQAITNSVIEKIEEAIDGMSPDGNYVCTANYISEYGSVGYLSQKGNVVEMIFPIMEDNKPTWEDRFNYDKCMEIKKNAFDWFGEYLCDPAKSADKFFDIDKIDIDIKNVRTPIEESAGVRYWAKYLPHHRYGQGSDHSEGVGLDSNTLAGFDFTTGELVYDYANNRISPDLSAHEFARIGREFGNCVYAPETNNRCGGIVITTLKTIGYSNLYKQRNEERYNTIVSEKLGWDTNKVTKTTMYMDFKRDYKDGLIKIYDIDVLKEMRAYSNQDLNDDKVGLITRHFDLLTAVVIAWQMNKFASTAFREEKQEPIPLQYSDIGL